MLLLQQLGVPVEGKVRVQLNLRVEQAPSIKCVEKFRDFLFPIMWLEEVSLSLNFLHSPHGHVLNGKFINLFFRRFISFVKLGHQRINATNPPLDLSWNCFRSDRNSTAILRHDSRRCIHHHFRLYPGIQKLCILNGSHRRDCRNGSTIAETWK